MRAKRAPRRFVRGRTRIAAVVTVAGLVALVPAVFGASATPIAPNPATPLSPLTSIDITPDLSCSVQYDGDTADEWFTEQDEAGNNLPDACGTFVALPNSDGPTTIFGPSVVPGADSLTVGGPSWRYEPYTVPTDDNGNPDNQVNGGSGTSDDPYTVTTTVDLDGTDLQLVETDSYINGQNSYRSDVRLVNNTDFTVTPVIYHAGDCFLQDFDEGFGSVQQTDSGSAPICNGATPPAFQRAARAASPAAAPDPASRIIGMYPLGSGSHYLEGYFDCVWQGIAAGTQFADVKDAGATSSGDGCSSQDPGGNPYDNGLGLSWPLTIGAGGSATVSTLNVFSPGGAAPLTVTKSAAKDAVAVGDTDSFTITVTNPGDQDETLSDLVDNLPSEFTYNNGSTTGATTDDPSGSGNQLDWPGLVVPAAANGKPGALTLTFDATANAPGFTQNTAEASGQDLTIDNSNATADVTISPKAVNDGVYETSYETAKTVDAASGLLANDRPNGSPNAVDTGTVSAPAHGTVTVNADGSFTYTPNSGYFGTDSFTYHDVYRPLRSEAVLTSNTATVSLKVDAPPAPVAANDPYSTGYETALTENAANGLLKNDTPSAADQPLTVDTASVSHPLHGTVTVNTDGSFTYTPATGFAGMDTFTYKARSAGQESNQATATITVGPSPAPVAADDGPYPTPYETLLTVNATNGLLHNDTPAKDQTTTVDTSTVSAPGHGTVHVNADGSFTYTPTNGYTGPDSFTYRDIANGVQSNLATASITVGDFSAPVANNDTYSTPFGTTLTVGSAPGLLNNDTGPKDQTLTVDTTTVSTPGHGSVSVNSDGSFTYTPDNNFTGTDTFTYKDVAGGKESNQATVSITVGADPRPIAVDDGPYSVSRNGSKTLAAPGVLANDTDPNHLALTAVLPTQPAHGTVTLKADGSFVYTPNNGYDGPDSFTYKARNSNGDTSVNAATVSFNVVDDPPDAAPDNYNTQQETPLTVGAPGVLENDSDPNGDALTAHLVTPASNGAVTLNADGSFTYSPQVGFVGVDQFTYTASDGTKSSAATTVTIDVTAPPPNAVGDSYTVTWNTALHVAAPGVLANDTPQNGSLNAHKESDPSHGTVTLNNDGSFDYTPDQGFVGTDSFTYSDTEGESSSDPATVTIQVIDHAPVAKADSYTTAQDTSLTVPAAGVLGNDTDTDGDTLTATLVTAANHGAVTLHANGSFDYSPPAGFHGTATFTYRASDGALDSAAATVTIQVTAAVVPPPSSPVTSTTPPPPPPSSPLPPPPVSTTPTIVPPAQPTTPQDTFPAPPTSSIPSPATSTPTTPPPSTTPPKTTHSNLTLSSPSVNPGGQLTATGRGCTPNSTVLVSVNGHAAGQGTADASGAFSIPASAPNLPVGNYTVVATCGNRQLTSEVALVVNTGTSATPAARSLTVATLLAFFILLLGLIVRRPT